MVADPDPQDPYIFGPPSFYNQAAIVRNTLIPTVLCLLKEFLSLKNDSKVASKINKQKNLDNF
jgi:hypothetical protein